MHRRGFYVLAVLVLALSLAVAGCSILARKASTGGQVQGNQNNISSTNFDSAFIGPDLLSAKPLDPGLLQQIMQNYVPPKDDFSQYITFTENQDGWGGCVGRSMTHAMDIENEMECPYTPDLSDWYVHRRQEEIANGKPVDTGYLLEHYGDCPEAYLPTDYDKVTRTNKVNDYSTMPQPTAANDQEAAFYKIILLSHSIKPDKDVMQHLMMQYGPLLIEGDIPHVAKGHCMTVIGWDDSHKGGGAFKLLNSWGDHWGPNKDGTYWLTYSDLAAGAHHLDIRYIQNKVSDRTGTKYAYSARISLQGGPSALRNGLTVSIAAAGQEPWVFWDQPNHLHDHCYDNSRNLCIDIPLPDYAAANWFPSANAQWSIQVTNHNSGAVTLQEFTVARQDKDANGKLSVETYTSDQNGSIVQGGGTASFTIPSTATKVILPVYTHNPFSLLPS
jgi:hypothetical protein